RLIHLLVSLTTHLFSCSNGPMLSQHVAELLRSCLRSSTVLMIVAVLLAFSIAISPVAFADTWPGWRGNGSGVSSESDLPHAWSPTASLVWVGGIPGEGLSSPIVCNERVFLTTAVHEPEWQWASLVLLTLFTVLSLFVLLSYLADPQQPTSAVRLVTFGA